MKTDEAGLGRFQSLPAGIAAGFTTSVGAPEALDGDRALRRLAGILGRPDAHAALARQVHGRSVLFADSTGARNATDVLGEGDAVVTDRPGVLVAVASADCVPILLYEPRAGLVAAVHAGWRGTALRILDAVLDVFASRGGDPERVLAAFGPSISRDRYEVGPEVVKALRDAHGEVPGAIVPGRGDRSFVDVAAFDRANLLARGVHPERIETCGLCTASTPALPSYRRDGPETGRIFTGIVLTG